jgi:hypothetical protein
MNLDAVKRFLDILLIAAGILSAIILLLAILVWPGI